MLGSWVRNCSHVSSLILLSVHVDDIISYQLPFIVFISSFSSLYSHSLVNVLLHANASLINFTPSTPILLSIYFIYISFSLSLFHTTHFFLSFSLFFFSLLFILISFSLLFITFQIQCSQCTIEFQSFTYHICSWIPNVAIFSFIWISNPVTYLFHFYINLFFFHLLSLSFSFLSPFKSNIFVGLHFLSATHTMK